MFQLKLKANVTKLSLCLVASRFDFAVKAGMWGGGSISLDTLYVHLRGRTRENLQHAFPRVMESGVMNYTRQTSASSCLFGLARLAAAMGLHTRRAGAAYVDRININHARVERRRCDAGI